MCSLGTSYSVIPYSNFQRFILENNALVQSQSSAPQIWDMLKSNVLKILWSLLLKTSY